jgi:3-keto-5-aminohexanoate cleavage enzyme
MHKISINFCPTGMVPTKEMSPHVPISPQEIIEEVHQAYEIGITIAHLHARDINQSPTYRKSVYQEIFEGVRKHCPDLVICGSSSGRKDPEFEKRSEVIELKPDMCSLTLSSLNFTKQASLNSPDMIQKLAEKMNYFGVHPELECFDLGMINYGLYLIKKNIIEGPFYWNLLFGNIAGYQSNLNHISAAISELPVGHHISMGGLGDDQLKVNAIAIAYGCGVRIGIEDSIWWDYARTKLCTNIELVKRIHSLIQIHQHDWYKPNEFGKLGFYNRYSVKHLDSK